MLITISVPIKIENKEKKADEIIIFLGQGPKTVAEISKNIKLAEWATTVLLVVLLKMNVLEKIDQNCASGHCIRDKKKQQWQIRKDENN